MVILLTVVLAARLSLPQPVAPQAVPLPSVNVRVQRHEAEQRRERLEGVNAEPLPFEIRAVGELVRRFGRAEAVGDAAEARRLRTELARLARAQVDGAEPGRLLKLRDLQTDLFCQELGAYGGSGPGSVQLQELGGALTSRLAPTADAAWQPPLQQEAAAVYRVRWTSILGLSDNLSFSPTATDFRLTGRFLLRQAERVAEPDRLRMRLAAIEQLAETAPDYPALLAAGVAYYQAADYQQAFEHLQQHLRSHPDGPWALRARNFATAAASALLK